MKIRHVATTVLLAIASASSQAAAATDAALLAKLAQQSAEVDEQRAITSFVSPGTLFPDGVTFTSRSQPKVKEKYQPLPAYDKPNGARIGEVRMTTGNCVDQEAAGCDQEGAWYLRTTAGAPYLLASSYYTSNVSALVSYRDSVRESAKVWSEIEYAKGKFWVLTDAASVFGYETLAEYSNGFDTWCSAPGACKAVDKRMAAQVANMEDANNECFRVAYNILGLVTAQGQQYYKVKLGELKADNKRSTLPKAGYIPVRNKDGSHTGTFEPNGC